MGLENRRQHRISVALEVRIRGTDLYGLPFTETTSSSNVSRGGCSVETSYELAMGAELEVEILRRVPGRSEPSLFLTQGVVMRVAKAEEDRFAVGIQFTGPHFPTYSSESTATSGA